MSVGAVEVYNFFSAEESLPHIVNKFDAFAVNGRGPTQNDANEAFGEIARHISERDYDSEPEASFWAFTRDRYGWSILEKRALERIAICVTGPMVEIGCGSGYASACLRAHGVNMIAYNGPNAWNDWWKKKWFNGIRTALATEINYDARSYLMCFPDKNGEGQDMMSEVLLRIPLDATLFIEADRYACGSKRGFEILYSLYECTETLDTLNCFPFEAQPKDLWMCRKVKAA